MAGVKDEKNTSKDSPCCIFKDCSRFLTIGEDCPFDTARTVLLELGASYGQWSNMTCNKNRKGAGLNLLPHRNAVPTRIGKINGSEL